ncbi:hypothetical protein BDY19DRAFT_909697 [Irpex rosettiformis]|uniref:Uncharacterized protein n=1 Tax=Irpex rosettiformis TaxID=378272 RepID=A0ACB8TRE4_9APHY|nr:hypothetical protein BDY19DRAFT_909697 [Irpex rosettiformis]
MLQTGSGLLWRLLRLCKGSSRPKSPFSRLSHSEKQPPEPEGDAGISLPWQFQHNVHVGISEGQMIGLPAAWVAALQGRGEANHEDNPQLTASDQEAHAVISDCHSKDAPTSSTSDAKQFTLETLSRCPHHSSCPFRNLDLEKIILANDMYKYAA